MIQASFTSFFYQVGNTYIDNSKTFVKSITESSGIVGLFDKLEDSVVEMQTFLEM